MRGNPHTCIGEKSWALKEEGKDFLASGGFNNFFFLHVIDIFWKFCMLFWWSHYDMLHSCNVCLEDAFYTQFFYHQLPRKTRKPSHLANSCLNNVNVFGAACVVSCCSCIWLLANVWTVAHQAPLSMGFSRQEYWSGLPGPPPGYLPDPGIEYASLTSPELADRFFTTSATWEAGVIQIWCCRMVLTKCNILRRHFWWDNSSSKGNDTCVSVIYFVLCPHKVG